MLVIEDLSKNYGPIRAVDKLGFKVDEGAIHGLVGPNGSGKTTTFKSIVGLVIPDTGRILLDGVNLLHDENRKRIPIGYSPETLGSPGWMRVWDFLYVMNRMEGLNKKDAEAMTEESLKLFDLKTLAGSKLSSLSKGQKKRILIAQAMTGDKRLYILDEPMTGLDPDWVVATREIIKNKANNGSIVLVSSHLLRELEAFIDGVTIIKYGKLVYNGSLEGLGAAAGLKSYRVLLEVDSPDKALSIIGGLGIETAKLVNDNRVSVEFNDREEAPLLIKQLADAGVRIYEARRIEVSLEEAYLRLIRGRR